MEQPAELTLEHVPPESSLESVELDVWPHWEGLSDKEETSRSAIKFRSTCHTCNNERLARVDSDLASLCADVRVWLGQKTRYRGFNKKGAFRCNVRAVMQSVVGHALAALTFTPRSSMDCAMRDFVMGDNPSGKGFFVLAYAHTDRFVRLTLNALMMEPPFPNMYPSHLSWPPLGFIIVAQSGRFKNWPLTYLNPYTSAVQLRLMSPQDVSVWMNERSYILGLNKVSSVIGKPRNEALP